MAIFFHDEKIKSNLKGKRDLKSWITKVIEAENHVPGDINIILTTDRHLKKFNKSFLSRDYYTDIITFDYTEDSVVSGDLYISLDRIKENSRLYKEGEEKELRRVIVHGVLHLIGYDDSDERDKKVMQEKENYFLAMLPGID
ncbi:rRNA maturation RNase YbeY [Bacteroidota bacterium]